MPRHSRVFSFIGLVLALGGCAGDAAVLRVDGSAGVAPLVAALADAYAGSGGDTMAVASGLGSRARLDSLERGAIDIAMASHGLDSADLARRGLVAHEIARTAVVFAVNRAVNVTSLLPEEICDIYAGRKPAWQLFGDSARQIVPLMRPADEVDAEVAIAAIPCLRDMTYGSSIVMRERADEMAVAIRDTPGAIGLTSLPYVNQSDGAMRALALDSVSPVADSLASGAWPMTRRAFLVTRASPSPAVAAFLEFVRGPWGEEVIRDNGAIPPPTPPATR